MRLVSLVVLAGAATFSADAPIVPVSVCEVLRDLPAHDGKEIAVLGRYSFRENGRWIGEQACDPALDVPAQLWLVERLSDGPKPPDQFDLDAVALKKKLADIKRRTSLGKFRFGTPDYDRWAVIYGEVKARQGEDAKKAPANLVYRGDGVVVFLTGE